MFSSTGLAFLEPGHLALMIPIIIFTIPIVGILTAHQRKMAEIIHARQNAAAPEEIAALRQEVAELKQLMHQQAIALDNLVAKQDRELAERVGR